MNVKELTNEITLHDSVVNKCMYHPNDGRLYFSLELCNFMQNFYEESDSENVCGKLVFSGVKYWRSDPDISPIEWGNADGQILDISLIRNGNEKYNIRIVLQISDYIKNSEDIFVTDFFAETFEWVPDKSEIIVNSTHNCEYLITA